MKHLDSSVIIDLMREIHRGQVGPARRFIETGDEELAISVHVICELLAGAYLARDPARERRMVDAVTANMTVAYPDSRFGSRYGELFAHLSRAGQRIGAMDLLIGTAAILAGAPLVTRNVKHFARIPGLVVLTYVWR